MSTPATADAPVLLEASQPPARPRPSAARRALVRVGRWLASAADWLFGALALTVGLSVLAATPVAQLLTFGYLLEAGGRVARTGRLRAGFVGVRKASRLGSMAVGVGLVVLPLRFVASLADAARLVDPGSPTARAWKAGLVALTVFGFLHVVGACARGGRLRHFALPFGNPFRLARRLRAGGAYASARDAVWSFAGGLRLPYYFRLGLFGFLGTTLWLAVPVSLLAAGRRWPVLDLPGVLLLGLVAMPLPFLQVRYAAEGRFRALFELGKVRERYRHAPWAFAFALALTLVASVPLYLLKIEMIPRETVWLPSLVFLAFIVPARLAGGWAYGRSTRREQPRHWAFRHSGRLALLPVVAVYVLFVFLSQYTAWRGVWSLYEQHAFLVPVPFFGL